MSTEIRSCEDALRLLAAYLDGELHPDSGEELERHLDTCRSCYSRAEFEKRLKAHVSALGQEPVAAGLEDRVRSLIRSFDVAPDT